MTSCTYRHVSSYNFALYVTRIVTSSTIERFQRFLWKNQLQGSNKQNDTQSLPDSYLIVCNIIIYLYLYWKWSDKDPDVCNELLNYY